MKKELKDAILNGLYDSKYLGHELLSPKLLENNSNDNIWVTLRRELLTCKTFTWAVAFITEDMLVPLKVVLADLASKKISGVLITGNYLGFNTPKVFDELQKIPNLRVKISTENAFHAKGYLFQHNDYETLIIGSANFTRSALLSNYEWSLKVTSSTNAALTEQVGKQIKELSVNSTKLTNKWIENYSLNWTKPIQAKKIGNISQEILPNMMQKAALKNLSALIKQGKKRSLIVSATGTGKTYLGAFAVKNFHPKKFLYLVHRQQIAKKALTSFQQVIGSSKNNYGILSGNTHQLDARYVFATVQTMSQDKVIQKIQPKAFDYILIDEAHRAASPGYQKILHYFKPKFWLGMTATPERMDNQDVYKIFDYNLAYEIRLKEALSAKMLTPFHYVGVQDYEQNGQIIDETTQLRYLTADQRVKYILNQINYYGYCGTRPCGLIFCSRQEEAKIIAQKFTAKGHPAVALTNENNESTRQEVVKNLVSGKIEYIVTVDLFNEGIDIPELNQIVMLRNTQSSIIFIQQLGRGLRKYPEKDYVTVIDFIGNYKNNYLIPIALMGDKSRDKDQARRETVLPNFIGLSTINFSQIASSKILQSLDQIKLDSLYELRDAYTELKQKIDRIPLLQDFFDYGSISPLVFANHLALKHYGIFLQKMGKYPKLTKVQSKIIFFVTKELINGKRPHELVLLKLILKQQKVSQKKYLTELQKYGAYVNNDVLKSVDRILDLSFFDIKTGKTTKKMQYGGISLIEHNHSSYSFSLSMKELLTNSNDFYKLFIDVIETGLKISKNYNSHSQFTLYKQYNRKDVCRLLNWPKDVSAPMYGYRVDKKETPIFITYKKEKKMNKGNTIYHNVLENGQNLRWYTRTPRHLDSDEVHRLLNTRDMKIHLFVKKNDAAGKQFYYLGKAQIQKETVREEKIGIKGKVAVGMDLALLHPLSETMYELLFD